MIKLEYGCRVRAQPRSILHNVGGDTEPQSEAIGYST